MRDKINLEELPEVLTPEQVEVFAELCDALPPSPEWREIYRHLSIAQRRQVNDAVSLLQREKQNRKLAALTEEERAARESANKAAAQKAGTKFIGNMGEPETPEEFKNKYGKYPPGYKPE